MAINPLETSPQGTPEHEPATIPKWPILSITETVRINGAEEQAAEAKYRVDIPPLELIEELATQIGVRRNLLIQNGTIPPGLTMVRILPNSKYADIARHVEGREFKEAWYEDMSYEQFSHEMQAEYGPYDSKSRFILLMDMENLDSNQLPKLVGMARLVGGTPELLKTVNDMQEVWGMTREEILEDIKKCESPQCEGIPQMGDPEHTWDCSSMAVSNDYRNTMAYPIISHELFHWCTESGINTTTTILVEKFFKLYRFRGVPFRTIGAAEPEVHMGEVSLPAVLHWPEVSDMPANEDNPRALNGYVEMAQGVGLNYLAFETA